MVLETPYATVLHYSGIQTSDNIIFAIIVAFVCFYGSLGFYEFCIYIISLAKALQRTLIRPFILPSNHTYKNYGRPDAYKKTWAVVTGATEGIGLAFCKQLAQQGFNIIMVSRNEAKMQQRVKEIMNVAGRPDFEAQIVVADFSKLDSIQQYRDTIVSKVKHYDIGLVVINAGHVYTGPMDWLSPEEVESMINCLSLQYIYLAKAFADVLQDRFKTTHSKGGMVIVSSILSKLVMPGTICYNASKFFASGIAKGLARELSGQVDVIDYYPGVVDSNMNGVSEAPDILKIPPDRAAQVCLRDLGCEESSPGSFRHWCFITHFLFVEFLESVRQGILQDMKKAFDSRMRKDQKIGHMQAQNEEQADKNLKNLCDQFLSIKQVRPSFKEGQ